MTIMTNMEKVAEILGLKVNDIFYIVGKSGSYVITQNGLKQFVNDIQVDVQDDTLGLLLLGKLEIDQRYWPKKGSNYYVPGLQGVEQYTWHNNDMDRYYFDNYLVCENYDTAKKLLTKFLVVAKEFANEN